MTDLIGCRAGCGVMFAGATEESREAFRDRHEYVVHGRTFPRLLRSPTATLEEPSGYQPTSRNAWMDSLPKLNATQKVILGLYERHGPMTDEAMFEAYGALEPNAYRNTVLPARTALLKAGVVYDTGKRATVRSGKTAIVWAPR